ncbi:MAG: HAD-IIIA family hydrolase [Rhodospirillaceae bacterium]|nr:HAD-IIIA family hydrolase [Rhodospirillaceae bacterium]
MTIFPEPKSFPTGAHLHDGVWVQAISAKDITNTRPALFLDRDGVLVEEVNYLHKVEDVSLSEHATAIIRAANHANMAVVVVTNQAGIGYGKYGWDEFVAVQEKILADVAADGGRIDGVFACPFHETGKPPHNVTDHPARKPNPGMLFLARDLMGIDLTKSWIIGDRASDLGAGKNASVAGGIHVLSGHGSVSGEVERAVELNSGDFTVRTADSIADCEFVIELMGA